MEVTKFPAIERGSKFKMGLLIFVSAGAFAFLYAPIATLIIYSFNTKGFPAPWNEFTFDWYYKLYHDSELWASFGISCIVAFSATFLSLLMGICLIFLRSTGTKVGKFLPLF